MCENIFQEWKLRPLHAGQRFIEDGIIDPAKWKSSPRKVLFLLKEAYDTKNESTGFNLGALVRDKWMGPKGSTWWRMGYWAYLLQNISETKIPDYPKYRSYAKESLLSSAVVNIRKSAGEKTSDNKIITEYAKHDCDLLRTQINDINPDIIVCGGTWNQAKIILPYYNNISSRIAHIGNRTMINFVHPAARRNNQLMYFSLAGIYTTSLQL